MLAESLTQKSGVSGPRPFICVTPYFITDNCWILRRSVPHSFHSDVSHSAGFWNKCLIQKYLKREGKGRGLMTPIGLSWGANNPGNCRLYRMGVSPAQKPRAREMSARSCVLRSVWPQISSENRRIWWRKNAYWNQLNSGTLCCSFISRWRRVARGHNSPESIPCHWSQSDTHRNLTGRPPNIGTTGRRVNS